jgi:hypothetical protein
MNKSIKKIKKNNKGAALIIVLFTLVIVSVFMSLMYAVSRKQILSETKERQASLYSQYLRTTLDLLVSPLIMGNLGNTNNNINNVDYTNKEDFQLMINEQPLGQSDQISLDNNNSIFIGHASGWVQNRNGYSFDIYYRINNTNNLWVLSYVNIVRRRINGALTIIPTYDITINTVVAELNNPNGNFNNVIGRLSNSQIRYSGRVLATVVQRTPYNISTNTAMFVKHQMMWNPFAADPFVALNSPNNRADNIDRCVGLTDGYDIKGDLSAPNLKQEDVNNAFRVNSGQSALNTSGLTGVWYGTNSNSRLISGGSSTGYVNVYVNNSNLTSASDFSIKSYNTKKLNSTGVNEGKLPGTDNNGNIDLSKINNNQMVRININSNNAVLVGSNSNGEITRRPQNGGLIEMVWPTDDNNNFMPNNDTTKAIVNSYPPKYATVYIVPNGNELTIFAVGGYSKQRVNVKTLLYNIQNLPSNGRTIDNTNNEIRIDLNSLTRTERDNLMAIHVNGGNVVVMPNGTNNNGLYYFENNNTNNPPKSFDLTVISTRFANTDSLTNRNFYQDNGAAGDLGGWNIPSNFNPNNGQITLGNGGATYILPAPSDSKWDNRRQVVRALEGNVIINNFRDNDYDFKNTGESVGFVGYNYNNGRYERFIKVRVNNNEITVPLKPLNIVSQNFVILNYQDKNYNSNNFYLSANIITTRGSLTIPDRDIYRWLMDGGRFNVNEYNDTNNGFISYIIKDKTLKWYGKYIANFSSVEGVVNPNNNQEILGFSNVQLNAADTEDLGKAMPTVNRQDWYISIGSKKIILYDIVRFELNK